MAKNYTPLVAGTASEYYNFNTVFQQLDDAIADHALKAFDVTGTTYGATGDGVTDDTVAVQAAITDAEVSGGIVFLPAGNYVISDTLTVSHSVRILGAGASKTMLRPTAAMSGKDTLELSPDTSPIDDLFYEIGHIGILAAAGGTSRHALEIDLSVATQAMVRLWVHDCYLSCTTGSAIHLDNGSDPASPTNTDGFFTSVIERNQLVRGVELINAGDSLIIKDNTVTGAVIGIDLSLVDTASQALIMGNNITSTLGAIRIQNGRQTHILYNQIECTATVSIGAVINLAGRSGYTLHACEVACNNIAGNANVAWGVYVDYCDKAVIRGNRINAGATAHIAVSANATSTRIYADNFADAGAGETAPTIIDAGTATCGVAKGASLGNGWQNVGVGYQSAAYWKDAATDVVHICGEISSGTTTPGTVIFTLPAGFRPGELGIYPTTSDAGAGAIWAAVSVANTGAVAIQAGSSGRFSLGGISFPATKP